MDFPILSEFAKACISHCGPVTPVQVAKATNLAKVMTSEIVSQALILACMHHNFAVATSLIETFGQAIDINTMYQNKNALAWLIKGCECKIYSYSSIIWPEDLPEERGATDNYKDRNEIIKLSQLLIDRYGSVMEANQPDGFIFCSYYKNGLDHVVTWMLDKYGAELNYQNEDDPDSILRGSLCDSDVTKRVMATCAYASVN